ncbi:MAG TPA: hypothetical protein VGL13_16725, partial [Polyangiaceae bacterium]
MDFPARARVRAVLALAVAGLMWACDKGAGSGDSASKPAASSTAKWPRDGSAEKPLQVVLIPADGGTEEGTKSDFLPLFNAITKTQGL